MIAADHRPITYVEGDTVVYRASAIGACRVALIASRIGHEPGGTPERVQEAADQGVSLEPVALSHLAQSGWIIEARQEEVEREHVSPSGQRLLVRGHLDAVGDPQDGGSVAVVEVKSRNEADFVRVVESGWAAVPERHLWQVSSYAHGLGLTRIAYVAICRTTREVHTLLRDDIPVSWDDIAARMEDVEEAALWGDLPACHGLRDTWCSYYHIHTPRPYDPAHDLAELAAEYYEASSNAKAWKDLQEARRAPLLEALGERKRVQAGDLCVEVQAGGKGSTRLVVRPVSEEAPAW